MTVPLVVVDPRSPVPPFEQVRLGVVRQVQDGTLPAGTRLPTVRRLAADLGLAVNTVARAYRELEAAGVVETRGRHGTFVLAGQDASRRQAAAAAAQYAATVRRLGIGPEDALALVRAALHA